MHRQLEAWYRTLDRLVAAKTGIEVALYIASAICLVCNPTSCSTT